MSAKYMGCGNARPPKNERERVWLADLKAQATKFVQHLKTKHPTHPATKNLVREFKKLVLTTRCTGSRPRKYRCVSIA